MLVSFVLPRSQLTVALKLALWLSTCGFAPWGSPISYANVEVRPQPVALWSVSAAKP